MIYYKSGDKYQLDKDYTIQLRVCPPIDIVTKFITWTIEGLTIREGYAWDGPSGPTIDTKSFMRGSLVHDALYQLLREGHIEKQWREQADIELKRICLEDGMSRIRAWWVYHAVRLGGGPSADPKHKQPVLTAP